MYSVYDVWILFHTGFPIRTFPGLRMFSSSPGLFAAYHALHRLLVPRHPPYALSSLATILIFIMRLLYILRTFLILYCLVISLLTFLANL